MISIKIQSDETTAQVTQQAQKPQQAGKPSFQTQAVNTAILNAGKQVLTQGISQYGDLTGNYALSRTASEMFSIGADAMIALSSPVGAIAVGTKYATTIATSFIKQSRELKNTALAQERAGYISTQGSRYGR